MERRSKKTMIVFSLLQVMTGLLVAAGTLLAILLTVFGVNCLMIEDLGAERFMAVLGLVTVAVVSAGCYVALISFIAMCQRLKRGTAFTERNSRALHRIAVSLGIAAGMVLMTDLVLMIAYCGPDCSPFVLPLLMLHAAAFGFAGLGLICEALHMLVTRAVALQQESELTI